MKTVRLSDIPRVAVDAPDAEGVVKQVPIGVADGSPTMSLRVFTVEPGGHTPYHAHPWEHINYILAGHGELVDESGTGHPLSAGEYGIVLPNEQHQFRNTGDVDLQFVCLVPKERE